jgi:hypothetical protein
LPRQPAGTHLAISGANGVHFAFETNELPEPTVKIKPTKKYV